MSYLGKGDKAPDFKGVDQNGNEVSLSDYKGKKVILYFYPKDNTPGCTNEALNLRDNYEFWTGKGYEIIGISPDSVASHKKFAEKHNLPFTLIADPDKEIIKAYGAWGLKMLYGKEYEGLLRTTYVIDENGIIEEVFKKVKTKEHTEQIIKTLKLD